MSLTWEFEAGRQKFVWVHATDVPRNETRWYGNDDGRVRRMFIIKGFLFASCEMSGA